MFQRQSMHLKLSNAEPCNGTPKQQSHQQVPDCQLLPQSVSPPGPRTDAANADGSCLSNGEIIVFNDIDNSLTNSPIHHVSIVEQYEEDVLQVTKMTGQLPMASPRRYAKRLPGFPQRVSAARQENMDYATNACNCQSHNNNVDAGHNCSADTVKNLIDFVSHETALSSAKTPTSDNIYESPEKQKVLNKYFQVDFEDDKSYASYTDEVINAPQDNPQRCRCIPDGKHTDQEAYIGQRLASVSKEKLYMSHCSPDRESCRTHNGTAMYADSKNHSSVELTNDELDANLFRNLRNFTLSPDTTDYDSNCGDLDGLSTDLNCISDVGKLYTSMPVLEDGLSSGHASDTENNMMLVYDKQLQASEQDAEQETAVGSVSDFSTFETAVLPVAHLGQSPTEIKSAPSIPKLEQPSSEAQHVQKAMQEIRSVLKRAKQQQPEKLKFYDKASPVDSDTPVWVPRHNRPVIESARLEDAELHADLETDSLLSQQKHYDKSTLTITNNNPNGMSSKNTAIGNAQGSASATIRQGVGTSLTPISADACQNLSMLDESFIITKKMLYSKTSAGTSKQAETAHCVTQAKSRDKDGCFEPKVLIEGVIFRARYLGSTQLVCGGQPTKATRMMQAEEAVSRIKAPEGESQPSTEVDLFISTEKIMVLNTDAKEIMMDHALRTISYIADIGDLVVLMARRRLLHSKHNPSDAEGEADNELAKNNYTPKMICHVLKSNEAQFIAQSIGQAFQVAYIEFLKANGIDNEYLAKDVDYQEVLNSQEIFGDELEIFAKKELQKEVVVPKAKGEILGVVIVESGWGSMLPTVVIANLMSGGAASRCGQLNIGDQLIAINGLSLVGLPLSTCQSYIRNAKNHTVIKLTVVPCPPVVEVKILRPKALFQLGFSVQNGVICSLLRGGIAERGGVRVGHRIIEINNQSVVAVPHDTIVKLLSSSVGEILMKTMPTSMFRLLTGQETPLYI